MNTEQNVLDNRVFTSSQLVAKPIEEVFAFFSDPANLEAITPRSLSFRILRRSTEKMRSGTEFTYRLRLYGIPLIWRSLICDWNPGKSFVDVQLQGPYAKWHHTHTFTPTAEGTLVHDKVIYRLPMGRLGAWLGGRFVKSDIKKIFRHRHDCVEELLGGSSSDSSSSAEQR
jgi:ligand-binding SRPBCC domain-containing protein